LLFHSYKEELSLVDIFEIMKRNLGIIIIITLSTALLALLFSIVLSFVKTPDPLYQAVTKIEVSVSDAEKREQVLQAATDLMESDMIVQKAMEKAMIIGEIENVRKNIEIRRASNANILEIVVNNKDKENAKILADEIREQGVSLVQNILPLDGFKIVQETVVTDDVIRSENGVNVKLNTVIGGVFGFISIIFLVFFKRALNDKIASEEDVKKYLGLKVLVSIPNYASHSRIKRYLSIR